MNERPRWMLEVSEPPAELVDRIRARLDEPGCPYSGSVGRSHVLLSLGDEERHFWSPTLDIEFDVTESATRLRGKFGPHPEVWTMFVFLWSVLVAMWLGGAMFGAVQWLIGETPTGGFAVVVATAGLGGSCSINLLGQRTGHDQMADMRRFILDSIATSPSDAK